MVVSESIFHHVFLPYNCIPQKYIPQECTYLKTDSKFDESYRTIVDLFFKGEIFTALIFSLQLSEIYDERIQFKECFIENDSTYLP